MKKRTLHLALVASAALAISACGGPAAPVATQAEARAPDTADAAIAVIRRSFDAMGGLERLRLAGGKVRIAGVATVGGADAPVSVTFGGPGRFRLDYEAEDISYVFSEGACRKIAYGVSVRCTDDEARWMTPMKILVGLTFPAADAAQLGANLRLLDDATVEGTPCSVVEIRPGGTNLKMRAAYDKASGLLREVTFELASGAGAKSKWTVRFGDWRDEKKMQVPHLRTALLDGAEVWRDDARTVDFDGFDAHAFDPPLPPTVDEALPAKLPARRFSKADVGGIAVEIPTPAPAPGGAWPASDDVLSAPALGDALRLVHRGPVKDAARFKDKLKLRAAGDGKKPVGEPGLILLEIPETPDAPVLFLLYVAVEPEEIQVKISQ